MVVVRMERFGGKFFDDEKVKKKIWCDHRYQINRLPWLNGTEATTNRALDGSMYPS
jgi:hypothetical protein